MTYKTELHCHTSEVSKCSDVPAEQIVEKYIEKGYSTLVITNHFSPYSFDHIEDSPWNEKIDLFMSAYHNAVKAAKGRINILLGMEYRNVHAMNDYLVFGITEEFLRKYNTDNENNFIMMKLKAFRKIALENSLLIFQAHPFRNGMTITDPGLIDGIEVINGHKRHDSRNDIALMWAKKMGLLKCGGSDAHEPGDEGSVAVYSRKLIRTNDDLLKLFKSRYSIKSEN